MKDIGLKEFEYYKRIKTEKYGGQEKLNSEGVARDKFLSEDDTKIEGKESNSEDNTEYKIPLKQSLNDLLK